MEILYNNFPLVTIVVATYRRINSLQKAIDSLLSQTYKNIEIIVVDDNADDYWNGEVQNVIDLYKDEEKIKYIKNELNLGSANTRNVGINNSNGEYITFLDDDDIYLPKKVENQVLEMIKFNSDYSITDLNLYYENDDKNIIEHRTRPFLKNGDLSNLLRNHIMYHMTGTDTMMFKKSYLNKIGGFDPIDVGDEYYLMHKAILENGKFLYIPKCYIKAFVHKGEGGLSSGEGKILGENKLYLFKKKYFGILTRKEIKYVRMRHYAVLSFAYLRINKYGLFILNSFKSFISYPSQCLHLFIDRTR